MIYTDSEEMQSLIDQAVARLAQYPELDVSSLIDPDSPAVIVTRIWVPTEPVLGPYHGVCRRYGASTVIQINLNAPEYAVPLIAHELVHAIGGSELDAEVAEALVMQRGEHIIITRAELEAFAVHPEGDLVTIDVLEDVHMRRYEYKGQLLWTLDLEGGDTNGQIEDLKTL